MDDILTKTNSYDELVDMGFQIYSGLLLNLPFEGNKNSSLALGPFTNYCKEQLETGKAPEEIILDFFCNFTNIDDELFSIVRLVEREVVLFDSLEDAAFSKIHDINGPGSIKDILNQIEGTNDFIKLKELIRELRVRIVLTAHPTQFYTDQVLGILSSLTKSIKNKNLMGVRNSLLQLGKTRFKKTEKPTPLDEAESLLGIINNVMYKVIPNVHKKVIQKVYKQDYNGLLEKGIVELGFWPGGDRDGNPFVTTEITLRVASRLRELIIDNYTQELRELKNLLTFPGVTEIIESFHSKITENRYEDYKEFLNDILGLRELIRREHMAIYMENIDDLIFKIQCFGFHFATLDIRQDSSIHKELMELIYPDLSVDKINELVKLRKNIESMDFTTREVLFNNLLEKCQDAVLKDTLLSIKAIKNIKEGNGEMGCHRYIISNTQSVEDILTIWMLSAFSSSLDIVPLFETIEDLHNAPQIMEKLYSIPEYFDHLKNRNLKQHIMLGFSDGTKDGGYVAANWEIYKAKGILSSVSRSIGINSMFFDGRGGPPARGGGRTHKFYRSLGSKIDSKSIQLTIQGQTIASSYGTIDSATHNIEQLVSAGIENNVYQNREANTYELKFDIIERLSILAREYYLNLKNSKDFIPYLEEMTPLNYYGKSNIGSRPSKRASSGPLTLSSLRAIPFVGAWSQIKQNIPGFYGLGYALEELISGGELSQLKELYNKSLFFSTLIENSMQSLLKSNFNLTKYVGRDDKFKEIWNNIHNEAQRTIKNILLVSSQNELLENDPINRRSIKLRESLILPIMVIQQYGLSKIKSPETSNKEVYEKLVLKTLAASINASRNSV